MCPARRVVERDVPLLDCAGALCMNGECAGRVQAVEKCMAQICVRRAGAQEAQGEAGGKKMTREGGGNG